MAVTAKSIIAAVLSVIALWLGVVMLVGFGAEALVGIGFSERFIPFTNVHLMEEASEGAYSPLTDPPFLIHAAVVAILVAGCSTAFLARLVFRERPLVAVVPTFVLVVLLAALWSHVWSESYPSPMRLGVILYFGMLTVAAIVAVSVSRDRRADV